MEENKDAKQIISQLLENHHTSVSMIAHEIRNPLTLVSSALQVIEAQHPEVRKFHNWEQMMEDVQFMCSLLTELSTFNNSSTLHHSVFSIERLLKNVAVSFAISLDADDSDIEFTSRIQPGMGDFTGDKIKLEEVLLNLLRNAREAVGEKGLISLTAGQREDRIIIQCFVTSKENGTGLGLSSSKQTIEAHGGTIEAESSPKTGTVFTVTLPV